MIPWKAIWDISGPFIIAATTVFFIGVISLLILAIMPQGRARNVVRIVAMCVMMIGCWVSLHIALNYWVGR